MAKVRFEIIFTANQSAPEAREVATNSAYGHVLSVWDEDARLVGRGYTRIILANVPKEDWEGVRREVSRAASTWAMCDVRVLSGHSNVKTAQQRMLGVIKETPGLDLRVSTDSEIVVRKGKRGVEWDVLFDEDGRLIHGFRTDIDPSVGTYVRSGAEILRSLGAKA